MGTDTDPAVPKEWQSLTGTQRDVLTTLARDGASMSTEVADALGWTHTNRVSRALPDLRDAGLVESDPADDRPGTGKYNHLTNDGRALVETASKKFKEATHAE